jgi:cytochrome c peroxidase
MLGPRQPRICLGLRWLLRQARTFSLPLFLAMCVFATFAISHLSPDEPESIEMAAPPSGTESIAPIPHAIATNPARAAVGKALFADTRLSGSGRLSCSTCHDVDTNGAMKGHGLLPLDTPSVFNSALNSRLGWEGHYKSLEAQALVVLRMPAIGQGSSIPDMVASLRADDTLNQRFRRAYHRDIDQAGVLDALATYQRSLLTPGSRFDRSLQGDAEALTPREQRGYTQFKARGCVSCHQGRNVGGNLMQRAGIFHPLTRRGPRFVRVPSLRNVEVTPPYFHDGSAATLEDAVTRMAMAQLDVQMPAKEAGDIAAFLRSLTGRFEGRALRAPR